MSDRERSSDLRQLAHDVRNALNGVAVNLEVARSRTQRGVDVSEVAPFLETAAQQLELATRLHKRYTDVAQATDSAQLHEERSAAHHADDTSTHP
ncbi:MAG: hypothetical protein M3Z30_11580 [Gemmatimonadota bacterium]|nr:hypothetical protein [Gemmatimonadota bacterium]